MCINFVVGIMCFYENLWKSINKWFCRFSGIFRSLHSTVALNGNVHVCRQKCDFAWRTFHSRFHSCLSWIYSTLTEFHLLWHCHSRFNLFAIRTNFVSSVRKSALLSCLWMTVWVRHSEWCFKCFFTASVESLRTYKLKTRAGLLNKPALVIY